MNDSTAKNIAQIFRREAQSGNVSYGDAVVIHESNKSRVVMVPFYIARTIGTDLSIKIITYKKATPPTAWLAVEEKSISLNETASRKLLQAIREHLTVADGEGDGDYLLIKLAEGTTNLGEHDPAQVANALTKVLSRRDLITHLKAADLGTELTSALKRSIRIKGLQSAVENLRHNLDSGIDDEATYQQWCQQHSWSFGNSYFPPDQIRQITRSDKIDLLLPTVVGGFRDIVELKRPGMEVLRKDVSHENYYFASEVSKAIGQCHRYLDLLHQAADNGLLDHPEVVAYHPRATIIIGRSNDWDADKLRSLHGLNRRLNSISVMTFDHLLAQGERLLGIFDSEQVPDENDDEFPDLNVLDDPEIPF